MADSTGAKNSQVPTERLVTHAHVIAVIEETKSEYVSGYGKDAVFRNVSLGWWIHFEGNWKMYAGHTKPAVSQGSLVRITVQVV